MNRKRPNKLGFGPLAVLEWLCEAPMGNRFIATGGGGGRSGTRHVWFYEAGEPDADGSRKLSRFILGDDRGSDPGNALMIRMGGVTFVDTDGLTREGFDHRTPSPDRFGGKVSQSYFDFVAPFMKGRTREPFSYTDNIYVPNEGAYAFWREFGRPALDALRAEREEARRASDRIVLVSAVFVPDNEMPEEIRKVLPANISMPVRRPAARRAYATARVVKEGQGRLYVTEIQRLPTPPGGRWRDDPFSGSEPNVYVSKDDVMVDRASRSLGTKVAAIYAEQEEDSRSAIRQALDQLAPVLAQLGSRLDQQGSRAEDEVRDAIAEAARRASDDTDADSDAVATPRP